METIKNNMLYRKAVPCVCTYTHQTAIGHRTRFQKKKGNRGKHVRRRTHISRWSGLFTYFYLVRKFTCARLWLHVERYIYVYAIVWMVCLYTAICVHRIFSLRLLFFPTHSRHWRGAIAAPSIRRQNPVSWNNFFCCCCCCCMNRSRRHRHTQCHLWLRKSHRIVSLSLRARQLKGMSRALLFRFFFRVFFSVPSISRLCAIFRLLCKCIFVSIQFQVFFFSFVFPLFGWVDVRRHIAAWFDTNEWAIEQMAFKF